MKKFMSLASRHELPAPPGGWTAGVRAIPPKIVNTDSPQGFGFNAFIWRAD
jgi:hypothetical protein